MYDLGREKSEYVQALYETLLSILNSDGSGSVSPDDSASRHELIGMVKVKIDEAQPEGEGLVSGIGSSNIGNILDQYINSILDESAKHVLQTAPLHVISPDRDDTLVAVPDADGAGHIFLPDNFLRFVGLKMDGWLGIQTKHITPTDPKYALQKYPTTRGGVAKPVVVLTHRYEQSVAVKQEEILHISGTNGRLHITAGGVGRDMIWDTDLDTTINNFVNSYKNDYSAAGIDIAPWGLGVSGWGVEFKAKVAGIGFESVHAQTVAGDMATAVEIIAENKPASALQRAIEYYSTSNHAIEYFSYIANKAADKVQSNLKDAVTWVAASKVLQIMNNHSGAAEAMKQVELSYTNL